MVDRNQQVHSAENDLAMYYIHEHLWSQLLEGWDRSNLFGRLLACRSRAKRLYGDGSQV